MIKIRNMNLELGHFALSGIDFNVDVGDYFMLVGPTGAGKTLLMETIAGLHHPKSGEVWIDGRNVTSCEPERRNIGMVYQESALFPHLSVADNIVFGLTVKHVAKNIIRKELNEVAALMGVQQLLERKPGKLSGGEKQKVALARALALKPRLLLLDEPLSALDPDGRATLQKELKRMHRELKLTVLHVTHDFDEAMILGKHVAVMGEGSIQQVGTPEDVFQKPGNEFVARFTLMKNILNGKLQITGGKMNIFDCRSLRLMTASNLQNAAHACIRPENVIMSQVQGENRMNQFAGTIVSVEDRGALFQVAVDVPPLIHCQLTRRQFHELGLLLNKKVFIRLDPEDIHVF